MKTSLRASVVAAAAAVTALAAAAHLAVHAQAPSGQESHGAHGGPPAAGAEKKPPAAATAAPAMLEPFRVTMHELHHQGGVPRGWKFRIPRGDAAKGRALFADLECYKCHRIAGESFPAADADPKNVGPELTGMGELHPPEYIAESILAPNHVIVQGTGFTGLDGLSVMPSFADSITLAQWGDLVAYLGGLTGGHDHDRGAQEIRHERLAGDYRVRLVYVPGSHGRGAHHGPGHQHGGHHGAGQQQGQHGHGGHGRPQAPAAGHLMAFVLDRQTGEAVPYLPLSVTIDDGAPKPRTVRLAPMASARGFHYGADVALGERTRRLTLFIGATTMQVVDAPRGRFKTPVSVVLDWPPK